MKRGFTLVELMVVIGIMAIMGSLTVAGYRQMKRGMEERSVLQNVESFIKGAVQRAMIDRQSVGIYFWNETLQEEGDDFEIVVGKAVAVRRAGRISKVDGNYLCDEFGDLEYRSEQDEEEEDTSSSTKDMPKIKLYKMSEDGSIEAFIVNEMTEPRSFTVSFIHGDEEDATIQWCYAFKSDGGGGWNVGDAYGFEFADITLPHGYIFGSSADGQSPIAEAGKYYINMNGETKGSIPTVCSFRPGQSPKSIGKIKVNSGSK